MPHLTANVLLRHPSSGALHLLPDGSTLPDWADGLVGKHALRDVRGEQVPAVEMDRPKPPKRSGPGSSAAAWRNYASKNGVDVADDADRDEVIAALEAAEVPVD